MIAVISGTNRPEARSLEVSKISAKYLQDAGTEATIINLQDFDMSSLNGAQYSDSKPAGLQEQIDTLHKASGYLIVAPEYNGSMPGVLKYFIDHFEYPMTFEKMPVAFIGLGGRFGGVRPVEHLQQVFNYRSAFVYPERVFLMNVWEVLKAGQLEESYDNKIKLQAEGFVKFVGALKSGGLHPRFT